MEDYGSAELPDSFRLQVWEDDGGPPAPVRASAGVSVSVLRVAEDGRAAQAPGPDFDDRVVPTLPGRSGGARWRRDAVPAVLAAGDPLTPTGLSVEAGGPPWTQGRVDLATARWPGIG